jgi:osmotically inducible protein OsmC
MPISKASAEWEGSLREGKGSIKPEHATEAPFSLSSRFEGGRGSNPEEFIGAGLSACFSMALAASLGGAHFNPTAIHTTADVHLDKDGAGFKISKIELTTKAQVAGIDDEKFQAIAAETKKQCPVSKALAGTEIVLTATLG